MEAETTDNKQYEVFLGRSRASMEALWYFRVKGANGEIMTVGEGYVSKYNAKRALRNLFGQHIQPIEVTGIEEAPAS